MIHPIMIPIKGSIFNGGMIEYCMPFGLSATIKPEKDTVYVYKFDSTDVVEVSLFENKITVIEFMQGKEGLARKMEESLPFFHGYFESAGLQGKSFLFDCSTKMPLRYTDFVQNKGSVNPKYNLFVFDNKKDGYICEKRNVYAFVTTDTLFSIDNSIFSLFQKLAGIAKVKYRIELFGASVVTTIAGLMNKISKESIEIQMEKADMCAKMITPYDTVPLTESKMIEKVKGLKIDALYTLMYSMHASAVEDEEEILYDTDNINLTTLASIGLDFFTKKVKNPKKKVSVTIDTVCYNVRSIYIYEGAAYVRFAGKPDMTYIKDMLNSENVQELMN